MKQLVVQLSDSQAIETGLGTTGLDETFPAALRRFAAGRLPDGEPIFGQVDRWDSPILLAAEHFR